HGLEPDTQRGPQRVLVPLHRQVLDPGASLRELVERLVQVTEADERRQLGARASEQEVPAGLAIGTKVLARVARMRYGRDRRVDVAGGIEVAQTARHHRVHIPGAVAAVLTVEAELVIVERGLARRGWPARSGLEVHVVVRVVEETARQPVLVEG